MAPAEESCLNDDALARQEVAKIDDGWIFTTCEHDAALGVCNMAWDVAKACSRACHICKDSDSLGAVAICEGHGYHKETCEGFRDGEHEKCCYWEASANDCWSDRGYRECHNTSHVDPSVVPANFATEYSAPGSTPPKSSSYIYDTCMEIKSENECTKSAHSSVGAGKGISHGMFCTWCVIDSTDGTSAHSGCYSKEDSLAFRADRAKCEGSLDVYQYSYSTNGTDELGFSTSATANSDDYGSEMSGTKIGTVVIFSLLAVLCAIGVAKKIAGKRRTITSYESSYAGDPTNNSPSNSDSIVHGLSPLHHQDNPVVAPAPAPAAGLNKPSRDVDLSDVDAL